MSENTYGLALGGGAARAFVSIGVIRYLEEKNIKISQIAGTSMGALLGAFYATGLNSYEIEKICLEEQNYYKFADPHFGAGLLKGEKLKKRFEYYFGNTQIQNLPIKMKITATSIESGELKIFESGKLVDALRATTSIPWIFRPYRFENEHFMDGGIVKNLPVDLLEVNNKIAVSALRKPKGPIIWKKQVLGLEVNKKFFGLGSQIFSRSINIMMRQNEKTSLSQATGNVELLEFSFGDLSGSSFDKVNILVKLGYNKAKEKLSF